MKYITIIFLFAAFAATAQTKADQARAYLGDYRYTQDVPRGEVKFVFQKSILKRQGNGKTYRDLLPDAQFFSNENNAGRLIGILVNGQTIMPEPKGDSSPTKEGSSAVKEASLGELQPIPEGIPEGQRQTFFESLPDSSELEAMKNSFIRQKVSFGRELAPRQGFLTWFYWNFIAPVLLLIGIASWYVAKAAFSDSAHSRDGVALFGFEISRWGAYCRYIVFSVATINCLVFIIDMLIADYFGATNMWWWLIKSVVVAILCWKFTAWVVPNPVVKNVIANGGGNYPRIAG